MGVKPDTLTASSSSAVKITFNVGFSFQQHSLHSKHLSMEIPGSEETNKTSHEIIAIEEIRRRLSHIIAIGTTRFELIFYRIKMVACSLCLHLACSNRCPENCFLSNFSIKIKNSMSCLTQTHPTLVGEELAFSLPPTLRTCAPKGYVEGGRGNILVCQRFPGSYPK